MAIPVEPGEFRAGQRAQWNTAAAAWRKWAPLITRGTGVVSERLVELAEIRPGHRVLDVAAGFGEPALAAARLVGPQGEVVATDISAEMLAYARERAADAGLENVRFVESDAASLEFPERSFDAALSRWGIIFDPEPEQAAARIRRFVKPGARMAISSWGPSERVPMFALSMGTVLRVLQVPPPPAGMPGALSRPTPEALAALLEGGGFSNVHVEEIEVVIEYSSPEEFVTCSLEMGQPLRALLAQHPRDAQDEALIAMTEAARERAGRDGAVALSNQALLAAGEA
jgi:SAM-dependent methyltransferase